MNTAKDLVQRWVNPFLLEGLEGCRPNYRIEKGFDEVIVPVIRFCMNLGPEGRCPPFFWSRVIRSPF